MATNADPYRTLGVAQGAPLAEVKRAYRRLAKANHPDAAGEAALPRFLAIQAAYDQIVGPDSGVRATGRTPTSRSPWEADPSRAGATDRAYGGRARRNPRTGGSRPGAGTPPPRPPSGGAGPARPRRPERPPNKATLGSTSYDGADAEPFEPDWGGASWYGTTSGTYWTLNPKEYADPRKHGPEYQARARRRRPDADAGTDEPMPPPPIDAADDVFDAGGEAAHGADEAATEARARRPGRPSTPPPTHTTASWWEATAGDGPGDVRRGAPRARPEPRPDREGRFGADAASSGAATLDTPALSADAAIAALRRFIVDGRPGVTGRVGRAVFGWAPVALGIGWVVGEVSGCGRFSATCDPAAAPVSWFAQLLALLLLLAVPRLARVTAVATIATIAASVSGAFVLSAVSGPDPAAASRTALAGLTVIAWGVGLVVAAARELRMARRTGPVS